MDKSKISKIVLVAILVLAVGGAYFFPRWKQSDVASASPAGSTFSTAKFYGKVINLATATTTSILNTDATDRYITSVVTGCEGVGTSFTPITGAPLTSSGWTYTVATSSTNAPIKPSSLNAALVLNASIATSSPWFVNASTTNVGATGATATSSMAATWPAGSYLTFWYNATNTAICTAGVNTIGS